MASRGSGGGADQDRVIVEAGVEQALNDDQPLIGCGDQVVDVLCRRNASSDI